MLLNFTCSNFRSFRDAQTFSLLPGTTKNHRSHIIKFGVTDILSVSAIFGANASGKSNIYKAMKFSRDFILGYKIDETSYFRLDPTYKEKPSTFEYEFTLENRIYRYGFQIIISQHKVLGEWLWRLSDNNSVEDELIFQRPVDNDQFPVKFIKLKYRNSKFLVLTLIDEIRRNKDKQLAELFDIRDWFEHNLKIVSTNTNLLHEIDYNEEQCLELGRLLSDFDTGIDTTGFKLVSNAKNSEFPKYKRDDLSISEHYVTKNKNEKTEAEVKEKDKSKKVWMLVNQHSRSNELFMWYDESDGTRRLMDLAPIIISPMPDVTFIVDELDRSLHPMVVYEFVRRFANVTPNQYRKQLIFTTHQTCLLDQALLRRDEIWFVQKNNEGNSELYSLEDYNERFDKNIEKMYLGGRYDAIPHINREVF